MCVEREREREKGVFPTRPRSYAAGSGETRKSGWETRKLCGTGGRIRGKRGGNGAAQQSKVKVLLYYNNCLL